MDTKEIRKIHSPEAKYLNGEFTFYACKACSNGVSVEHPCDAVKISLEFDKLKAKYDRISEENSSSS
jgi:hypothetical protein